MPLLTHKEGLNYKEKKQVLKKEPVLIQKNENIQTYILRHPEIPIEGEKPNYNITIKINSKDFFYMCKEGIVKTCYRELRDFLLKKEWELLNIDEDNNE